MPKLYFEDFSPGQIREFGPRVVTRDEVVTFAAEFDPQPMHLDEDAGRASILGGLAASGWHSCCLAMRMMADGLLLDSSSMGMDGVDEVKWLVPVRPGDALTLKVSVLETSRSGPDAGVVTMLLDMFNQDGTRVTALKCPLTFGTRAAS